MRCRYLSDLHLERQEVRGHLGSGDVLIIAGDLCHAAALDPAKTDAYSTTQRDRVHRFVDDARKAFAHVLLVIGNHEHHDGVRDDTAILLARHLPGVTLLDDKAVEIGGVGFFGTTLWTDLEGRSEASAAAVRRRIGDYFFIKTRERGEDGGERLRKFRPEDGVALFDVALAALRAFVAARHGRPSVVVTHHAPSYRGLNEHHSGNGLDGTYASRLDAEIATWAGVRHWVHGHTHVRRSYRIGDITVRVNCRGIDGRDASAFDGALAFNVEG